MSNRIRTTHVGSLPRPPELAALLAEREKGEPIDTVRLEELTAAAVDEAVARQRLIGIDIVNDGEMSKISYATYVGFRFSGITATSKNPHPNFLADSPYQSWAKSMEALFAPLSICWYECDGSLAIKDAEPLRRDLRNLREAAGKAAAQDVFMTAASPGIISSYVPNRYYPSHEAYLAALVPLVRDEYEAIVNAGFILQLDCPDLSTPQSNHMSDDERLARKELAIEAINAATANIDPNRMRLHLCWGNAEGPHDTDVPLLELLPLVCKARPASISFEGANPRHEHEWVVFEEFDLPDEKSIIPGVIDSTTNFIEHPELVAQRIERYVQLLGAERVIAGVDCGFGTHALLNTVDPEIAYAKLRSLVQGAEIASSGQRRLTSLRK